MLRSHGSTTGSLVTSTFKLNISK